MMMNDKTSNSHNKKTPKDFILKFEIIKDILKNQFIDGDLEKKRLEGANISRYCWMTSYQIAIIYNREYENVEEKYGLKVGGEGIDDDNSLAHKIAINLANKYIPNDPSKCHFECSQMSEEVLSKMEFSKGVTSTVCGKNINLYRYKD